MSQAFCAAAFAFPIALPAYSRVVSRRSCPQCAASSFICVETELRVWCEVLPPFHLMPRTLLATACNAVLRRALPSLLSVFVVQLGKEYARWAAEPDYRAARAAPKPALLAA